MNDAPAAEGGLRNANLVLLAGVPGAGKSTALRTLRGSPAVLCIDSEDPRHWLAAVLGDRVPYAAYRPLVHLIHLLRVVRAIAQGPQTGRVLIIHHPGTAPVFRQMVARLGRRAGWVPAAVFVDVDRDRALAGQRDRGRLIRSSSFDRHWTRWTALRERLIDSRTAPIGEPWATIHLSDREHVAPLLQELAHRSSIRVVNR